MPVYRSLAQRLGELVVATGAQVDLQQIELSLSWQVPNVQGHDVPLVGFSEPMVLQIRIQNQDPQY
jgi:hypothetical protein